MSWYDGRYTAFDVESTGTDTEEARIVQSATISVGGGEPTRSSVMLIDPGVEIPEAASEVHGITTERARAEGQPAAGAIMTIRNGLVAAIKAGRPITIYHAPFDLTLVDRECRRYGIDSPDWSAAFIIDPLVIWKWADRYRRGPRTLAAACECFGVELGDDAHDAGSDALATARLTWRMFHPVEGKPLVQGRHPEIIARRAFWKMIRESLPALQDAQREWQAEQSEGLRLHFESKGETEKAASVRVGWPWIPLSAPVE